MRVPAVTRKPGNRCFADQIRTGRSRGGGGDSLTDATSNTRVMVNFLPRMPVR
jgi:hypothetical protein